MKKIIMLIAVLLLVVLCCSGLNGANGEVSQDVLRIHIRANSNDVSDQNVKYAVKRAIVDYLTPYLAQAETKQHAMQIVSVHLQEINHVANEVLLQNGFDYQCNSMLCNEVFPTRSYDGVVFKSGVYDALIVNLGSGNGDNWWCVVYPPLCFVPSQSSGNGNVVFKWKILDIINNWKNSR